MALYASWSPGTAFMPPEIPSAGLSEVIHIRWTDVVGLRQNGCTTFKLATPVDVHRGFDIAVQVSFSQNQSVIFAAAGVDFDI